MDFLISSEGCNIAQAEKCWSYRTDRRIKGYELVKTDSFDVLVVGETVENNANDLTYWDGQYSISGNYRHPSIRGNYPDVSEVKGLSKDVDIPNGVFCALYVDKNLAEFYLSIDSLSQYPIFIAEINDGYAVSNNAYMLDVYLGGRKRLADAAIENCIYGGSFQSSHLESVSRLAFGMKLVGGNKLRVKPVKNHFESNSYEEAITKAHQSIRSHIESVCKATKGLNIVSDLTGGGDSRLILSFLLNILSPVEFSIRCMSTFPNPDANVAGLLVEKFGLQTANFPIIGTPLEKTLRASASIAGGALQADVAISSVDLPGLVHFQGTFGGISGSPGFNAYDALGGFSGGYSFTKHAELIASRRYQSGITSLINKSIFEEMTPRFSNYLEEVHNSGVLVEQLTAENYLRNRCRTHFGLQSFIRNRSRILPSPLANMWLVSARKHLSDQFISKNKVIYDLMEINGIESLTFAPMAGKKWSNSIVSKKYQSLLDTVDPVNFNSPNLSSITGTLYKTVSIGLKESYRRISDVSTDAKVGHLLHSSKISVYKGMCSLFINEFSKEHVLWDYWDRNNVQASIGKPLSDFRKDGLDIEVMGLFIVSAIWLTGLEMNEQISWSWK